MSSFFRARNIPYLSAFLGDIPVATRYIPYYTQEEDGTKISPAGAPSSAQPQTRVFLPMAGARQRPLQQRGTQSYVERNPYWSCAVEAPPLGVAGVT